MKQKKKKKKERNFFLSLSPWLDGRAVCVCVCQRERERERDGEVRKKPKIGFVFLNSPGSFFVGTKLTKRAL